MSIATDTATETNDCLHISVWVDPLVDRLGHDPRSTYVEQYWLGILGPSTVCGNDQSPNRHWVLARG